MTNWTFKVVSVNALKFDSRQRGAILIVALIFLLLTAAVSITVMKTSVLEVRMAGNEQFSVEAFQKAQALSNAIAVNPGNLVVTGDIGYRLCGTAAVDPDGNAITTDCDVTTIALDSSVVSAPSGVGVNYYAERIGPLLGTESKRSSEDQAWGSGSFKVAYFKVVGSYDGVASKLGTAEVEQGVAVRVAAGSQ
jgi:hypothetical protein